LSKHIKLQRSRGVVKSPVMGWGFDGRFVPGVGNLTRKFVKSPVFPTHTLGVGHEFGKCITGEADGVKPIKPRDRDP